MDLHSEGRHRVWRTSQRRRLGMAHGIGAPDKRGQRDDEVPHNSGQYAAPARCAVAARDAALGSDEGFETVAVAEQAASKWVVQPVSSRNFGEHRDCTGPGTQQVLET